MASTRRPKRVRARPVIAFTAFAATNPVLPLLLIAIFTLFAGPLIYLWMARGGHVARTLDRVIVCVLILLVVVLLVPEAVKALGWLAIGLVAVGYGLPGLLEVAVRRAAASMHLASLVLALFGLLLHAILDAAGLAGSDLQDDWGLAAAIILHRFGEGLMIWLLIQPAFGSRAGWLMLATMATATLLGYRYSEHLLPLAGDFAISVVQAIITGAIVHSLVHRGHATAADHSKGA